MERIRDLGYASDRPRIEHSVANDPKVPGPLGDQDVTVGQKRESPRACQSLDWDNAESLLRVVDDLGRVGQGLLSRVAETGEVTVSRCGSLLGAAGGHHQHEREGDDGGHGLLLRSFTHYQETSSVPRQ
jgi:hypothetical protein